MGCCGSRENDSDEDGFTSVRVESYPAPPSWVNGGSASRNSSASRLPKSTPSRVNVGPSWVNGPPSWNVVPNAPSPSRVNVGPSRVNVVPNAPSPSRVNVGPSRVNVGPSRVNVGPSRVNVVPNAPSPSRVNVGPSRVNVVPNAPSPSRVNVGPSRVNVVPNAPRNQMLVTRVVSDNSCIWDQIRRAQSYYPQPPEDHDEVESIGYSSQHNEERHFFQIFFSVLDQVPGHKGIFTRWKKEAQRAESENAAGRTNMSKVWNEPAGYVKTLQRIKMLVHNKGFRESDRAKLAEWSAKVVRRRTAQYNKAAAQGKEDSKHLKVLEEWRGVNSTIQNLL